MAYFDIFVTERREYSVLYRVEADDENEALILAEEGNTHDESKERLLSVTGRTISGEPQEVPVCISVEYDLSYSGGDYHGSGQYAELPIKGLTDENLKERFKKQTGIDPVHIVLHGVC